MYNARIIRQNLHTTCKRICWPVFKGGWNGHCRRTTTEPFQRQTTFIYQAVGKTPLLNEHVQRAISKGYPVISRLGVQESFGVGRTVSSWTALSDLTEYAVAEGWMKHWELQAKASGAVGFFVMRGSSYPCNICDDEVGFHVEWDKLPPYHGHCKCFAVSVSAI